MAATEQGTPEPADQWAARQKAAERLADDTSTEIYRLLGHTLKATELSIEFRRELLHLARIPRDK